MVGTIVVCFIIIIIISSLVVATTFNAYQYKHTKETLERHDNPDQPQVEERADF